jgi:tetratricopeptide (TPR) repeat protein
MFAANNFFNPGVFKYKVSNLFDLQAGSTAARTQFWQAAWETFKNRPLIGYGPENQVEELIRHYAPEWAIYNDVNVLPDRAHNLILDLLVTQGIPGLAFYLLLLAWLFYLIITNIKNNKDKQLNYGLFFSLVAYHAWLFFNFHHLTGLVYFWLLAALAVIIHGDFIPAKPNGEASKKKEIQAKISLASFLPFSFFAKFFLTITLSGVTLYLCSSQLNRLIADHYFFRLREAHNRQELFTSFELYDYLKEKSPHFSSYDEQFAYMLSDWTYVLDTSPFNRVVKEKLGAIYQKINAKNFSGIYLKAVVATALADENNRQYFTEAEKLFPSAIKISPRIPKNYRELGIMYNKRGNYAKAAEVLKTGLSLLPSVDNPYLNAMHKSALEREMYLDYLRLGDAYAGLKKYEDAVVYYNLAMEKNSYDTMLYSKLSGLYEKVSDYDKAIWYIDKGSELTPDDYYWPYALALIYEKQGQLDKAREYAGKALSIRPDHQDIISLEERLKNK